MSIIYLLKCPSDSNSRPFLQFQSISNRNSFRRKEQSDLVLPFLYEDIFVSVWELFELWEKEVFKFMVKSVTSILFFLRNCTKVTNHLVHYTTYLFYKIQMILLFYNYKKVIVHYFNLSFNQNYRIKFCEHMHNLYEGKASLKKCLFGIATLGYLDPGRRKINIFFIFQIWGIL